jgi:hypothetical protein
VLRDDDPVSEPRRRRTAGPRQVFTWGVVVLGLVFILMVGLAIARSAAGVLSFGRPAPPQITQAFVLERLQDVAKLVSSDMVLRDVVV